MHRHGSFIIPRFLLAALGTRSQALGILGGPEDIPHFRDIGIFHTDLLHHLIDQRGLCAIPQCAFNHLIGGGPTAATITVAAAQTLRSADVWPLP